MSSGNRATQPSRAATPRNSDAHKHIAVPKALCVLLEYTRPRPKSGKVPGIGSVPLDKLTTIQIQRFYNNLQKSGRVQRKNFPPLKDASLSPRVVRGVHTLLHNCLEQAVAERLILSNPAQGCKLPQLEKREMKILPQEKIGMYLAEAERRGLLAAF